MERTHSNTEGKQALECGLATKLANAPLRFTFVLLLSMEMYPYAHEANP